MNYHNITKDDMRNGDGLRVVLWVAGCNHYCPNCQNPITWDPTDGVRYDRNAWDEIEDQLRKPYISGITFSGGDPLYPGNREQVLAIAFRIKELFRDKNIWLYTGYTWEEIKDIQGIDLFDVIVDGPFVEELADTKYHWAGSTNQRVIDVAKSLATDQVVLYSDSSGDTDGYLSQHNDLEANRCGT